MDRRQPRPTRVAAIIVVALLAAQACDRPIHITVAQSALGLSQSIGQMQIAAEQLQRAGALDTRVALSVQEKLLKLSIRVENLLPTLHAIDRLYAANAPVTVAEIDAVLQIVIAISNDLSLVVAGVPVAETTAQLLELMRVTQQSVATTLIEIAKLRAILES